MSRRGREGEPWAHPPRPAPRTRFERSARFWLNAYPRRWRDQHGEELLGVMEDTAREADGRLPRRLPRADVVALLKAGGSLRWREHPPLWRWLGYRILDLRLPERYWWWVADDIRSRSFVSRDNVVRSLVPFAGFVMSVALMGLESPFASPLFCSLWWAVALGVGYLARRARRRHAWLRHVVEGNVPETMRAAEGAVGRMTPGVDPAITGELPEERPRS